MFPSSSTPVPGVSAERARELVEANEAMIVDVREPGEWAAARIPGAVHVPLNDVRARAEELPRDRVLVMQCASGGRSAMAAAALLAMGFPDVVNLEGGIMAWHQSGLPIER